MATTTSKKQKTEITSKIISDSYIDQVLTTNHIPNSIYSFCKSIDIEENDFYVHFNSFEAIEKNIWEKFVSDTIEKLHQDTTYSSYTVREKTLSFLFTFFEILKNNRSYVNYCFSKIKKTDLNPESLKSSKSHVKEFSRNLLYEAISTGEIIERKFISDKYVDAFWMQLLFLIRFWLKDTSTNFEKTDAAIEKIVNPAFDLAAKSPLDGILDLAKFLYQNR